ncbi:MULTISPECIES: hypothetical protein [unclassified Pseudomonas]|uniref:roadblock/LC7 domain-containing protein n=1 Tax=unclassified Pseudomonas TaxID=196821 RepID=UPI002448BCE1|nr:MULTISPECIES: hypothetical protein [unclassified Pseudomonas]MDH0897132.1 hypothetical protein [Pseudomonas sp. GD03875]MDH1064999.1 hypothetical protein [Pseudomonas sp. GD03985]
MDKMLPAMPESLRHDGEQALDELMTALGGLNAAVIATSDGFEVAARARFGLEVTKLAAMACSLSALGAMAGEESSVGLQQSLIIEASEGYVVIIDVPHPRFPMILNLVAEREETLGQLIYQAKRMATRLAACS